MDETKGAVAHGDVGADAARALAEYIANAYLMLFEDRFTVLLDDSGRFQKSFALDEWLGRFNAEDAERLVSLKQKIEARLAALARDGGGRIG